MKKGLLVLFMASMLVFAENQNVAKKHDKTAKLKKDSYCTVPKSHSDFKKINGKDYRVDVEFEKYVFDLAFSSATSPSTVLLRSSRARPNRTP